MIEFYLGGSRSGKSKLAETAAYQSNLKVIYVATCNPKDVAHDDQMQQRIDKHQQRRPDQWLLVEEPFDLAKVINNSNESHCIVIDCLTLWLSNCLFKEADDQNEEVNTRFFYQQKQALTSALDNAKSHVIFVSNETNMGVIPMGKINRVFCDEAGLLHQEIAAYSDKVTLAVAGLPHVLKEQSDITLNK